MLTKKIIQLTTIYILIASFLGFVYITLLDENSQKQSTTALQIAGVNYIQELSNINISIVQSIYKKERDEGLINPKIVVAKLKKIEKEYPKFQNDTLDTILYKVQDGTLTNKEYYELIDMLNKLNYIIGDRSQLLFEDNRKLHFLSALVTHYTPEYIISNLICHGIAEDYRATQKITQASKIIFLEQYKLINLSLEEIDAIVSLLQPYEDTQQLTQLLQQLQQITPQESDIFSAQHKLQEYIDVTHHLLGIAFAFNNTTFKIAKKSLQEKMSTLQKRMFRTTLIFLVLLILIGLIFIVYYQTVKSNILQTQEIQHAHEVLDRYVLYIRVDAFGYINHISDALVQLLNATSPDYFIGKDVASLFHIHDISKVTKQEVDLKTADEDTISVQQHILPYFDTHTNQLLSCDIYMQNITNEQRLRKLSITDPLTQLYNRHKLDEILGKCYATFKRYNTPFSVILLDIDHFKQINDTHGHLVGDEVLKKIAVLLQSNIRATDHLGRWGGEEFLIICEQSVGNEAYILAQKIRNTIALYDAFSLEKHVTVSLGVAQITHDIDILQLLKKVDNALYEAKENGRNTTILTT